MTTFRVAPAVIVAHLGPPLREPILTVTSHLPGRSAIIPNTLLTEFILPAAQSTNSLPANPKANARLQKLTKEIDRRVTQKHIWFTEEEGVAYNGEFIRKASPALKINFPKNSRKEKTDKPGQIMMMRTRNNDPFAVSILEIPKGVSLSEIGPLKGKEILEKIGSNVSVVSNKKIVLRDGTKAYQTELKWDFRSRIPLTTFAVSAYKNDKWVLVGSTTYKSFAEVTNIVQSLSFDLGIVQK